MTTLTTVKPTAELQMSARQAQAFGILRKPEAIELVFGGGARGGKTYFGSTWIIGECLEKPGSAWLIGREELKALKRTTMRTFFKVLKEFGLKKDIHYKFNAQEMVLSFANGSVVFFAELKMLPSDPEFDRLGSYDLTGYWIDEAQEVSKGAKDTLQFRLSVMTGRGWTAYPKALYTCNPKKNWIYQDFWKPIVKEKQKIPGKYFITSLFTDNPWIDHKKYKNNVIKTNDKIKIERLLFGNFEYDDDSRRLIEYDKIIDLFTRKLQQEKVEKYISADIARLGKDKTVIGLWEGLILKRVYVYHHAKTNETAQHIRQLATNEGVAMSNVIIDEDGVGGGVLDQLSGAKGFVNNSKCIQPKAAKEKPELKLNYANLKTQCTFKMAELINKGFMAIEEISEPDRIKLIEELDIIKQTEVDSDKKLSVLDKDGEKALLGRSPDYKDMLMMRMYFEIAPRQKVAFIPI